MNAYMFIHLVSDNDDVHQFVLSLKRGRKVPLNVPHHHHHHHRHHEWRKRCTFHLQLNGKGLKSINLMLCQGMTYKLQKVSNKLCSHFIAAFSPNFSSLSNSSVAKMHLHILTYNHLADPPSKDTIQHGNATPLP
ncbi:hypothetical protein GQX74_001536 [Glossina fuscipes]|nr:hypothetical protein GQX74_001536 [Glossina fuscipes]